MDFESTVKKDKFILSEGAVIELLRRSKHTQLHQHLENALLVYDRNGRTVLSKIYSDYASIARRADVPMVIFTPTWRANRDRIAHAQANQNVNFDATAFIRNLRDSWENNTRTFIGGLTGCKHDSYKPELGLTTPAAKSFHHYQVHQLAKAGVDFLLAATMPAIPEARGMALAMESTGVPYIISFVINRQGSIMDGNSIEKAIGSIDTACRRAPLGYMINCAYPSFLHAHQLPPQVLSRLVGFQANASSLDQSDLDGNTCLQVDAIDDWGNRMIQLHRRYGLKILGGCCGTGPAHLEYLVRELGFCQSVSKESSHG